MIRTVTLKSGREASIKRMHPWIFSGAIQKADEGIIEGDLVHVLDAKGAFVAQGHFSSGSLAVKVLSLSEETIDDHWFAQRLNEAKSLREVLGFPDKHTNAYRLVHGEGDGLPGLIIDIYADTAVIQPHSKGMERLLQTLSITLIEMGFKNTIHKPTGKGTTSVLVGAVSERIQIRENDMIFNVDVVNGQKTGFFLDQRESRALIGKYARDKNVLYVFSYTGGFSIAAALAGAKKVISFDASSKALDIAMENAALNNCSEVHSVIKGDAVKYLESLSETF
ncbi:MAG: class I SAM-dependent rRNA methyltransferase, partial [Salibacteraceae bacterium]